MLDILSPRKRLRLSYDDVMIIDDEIPVLKRNGKCEDESPSEDDIMNSIVTAKRVHYVITRTIQKWDAITPVEPEKFLCRLLEKRGYDNFMIKPSSICEPTNDQLEAYDKEIVTAVRTSDLATLKRLFCEGRSMSACNKYSESIVHKASRSAELEVFEFIITHGGDVSAADDYGRTSLHDVCWRAEPRFDIVTLILDRNINLLRTLDKRGFSPLRYIRQEHWLHWCAYFFHQKDKYWPLLRL